MCSGILSYIIQYQGVVGIIYIHSFVHKQKFHKIYGLRNWNTCVYLTKNVPIVDVYTLLFFTLCVFDLSM